MDRKLEQGEVAANTAPFRPHVERIFNASPRGLVLPPPSGPRGAELVSEVGAVPASGATPSPGGIASESRHSTATDGLPGGPLAKDSGIAPDAPPGGSLQRLANQARCHDALHSYLIEIAGYDVKAALPTFNKAVMAVEALANHLASRTRAEEAK